MADAPLSSARLQSARANLIAFLERLALDSLANDYRRNRDPSKSLRQLLELQEQKCRLGLEGVSPFIH
jgi:hypothetical protein